VVGVECIWLGSLDQLLLLLLLVESAAVVVVLVVVVFLTRGPGRGGSCRPAALGAMRIERSSQSSMLSSLSFCCTMSQSGELMAGM